MDLSLLKRPEGPESPKQQQQEQTRPKFSYTIASLLESVKRSSSPDSKAVVEKTEQAEEEEDEEEEEERVMSEEEQEEGESDLSVGEEEDDEGGPAHPRLAPSHPTPMHPLQVQFHTMQKVNSQKRIKFSDMSNMNNI